MEFRQLRYFACIAELQSMTKAAEVLFIAQPALSMQMRNLEEELGVQLLLRHSRGVHLTEAGQVFLEKAIRITRDIEAARRIAAPENGLENAPVRLGVNPSLDPDLIARILRAANESVLGTRITILEGASDQLVEWLLDSTLDMAMVYFVPDNASGIACDHLFRDDIVLLTDNVQPPRSGVPFEQLTVMPLMLQPKPHKLRSMIEASAAAIGREMCVPFEIRSVNMIIDLVERGLASSMLPEGAAKRAVANGRVNVSRIIEPNLSLDLSLAYLEPKRHSEAEVTLRRLIRELASR
jgi:LysR family nitrogen assimilation transcriptional regulator